MEHRGETSVHEPETAAVFTRTLAGLKRRGSGLLLIGPEPVMERACGRFLGESETEPRRRLFVRTRGGHACLHEPSAGGVKVVERATHTRSATATQSGGCGTDTTVVTSPSLPSLGIAIAEAIDEFERESGGLTSGELRVCFDSLTPLLEEHSRESVFRFLHVLTARIRNVNGMAHFHLPAEMDSTVVRALSPAFDAVVEVRAKGDVAEQRWHLVRQDVTTGWLSL
ncbi:DUF7504 family protein [Haladaptatus salinisoli]|uniref:DUF7504 family protein n=1 Tax=Haladaptatus salinisoli TaxID=2884876 RepID=UPI001D0BDDDB|nr:hypothetical protein [Haladaptatus salinisoli]